MADGNGNALWFGVKFSSNRTTIPKKFVKGYENELLGNFVSRCLDDRHNERVGRVWATKTNVNEPDANNNHTGFECDLDMPLTAIDNMGMKFLHVERITSESSDPQCSKSAFDLLMSIKKRDKLPSKRKIVHKRDELFNNVIDLLQQFNVKFTTQQVDIIGKQVAESLTEILWTIDPHHDKLEQRSCYIPSQLKAFHGYNQWKKQHKREPVLTQPELERLTDQLFQLLSVPYMLADRVKMFRETLTHLHESFLKYLKYLQGMTSRVAEASASATPVRSINDNWAFVTIEQTRNKAPECYNKIARKLQEGPVYHPVDLMDFEPEDRHKRQKWLTNLTLPFAYSKFTYSFGNNLGTVTTVWKQPELDTRNSSEDIRIISDIKNKIPTYATRKMRQEFLNRFSKVTKERPVIMRAMYKYLTGHHFASENGAEAAVDERVCEFLMASDDPKLVLDLRERNGNVNDEKFDPFWNELGKYLEEKTVVHERRQSTSTYMPFAISVKDLREQILARLPAGTEAPSTSWIRLNFMPQNPYQQ